jgi:hypothetical protein
LGDEARRFRSHRASVVRGDGYIIEAFNGYVREGLEPEGVAGAWRSSNFELACLRP